MAPIFKSGAFIQQCFAVHPRCLGIKKHALPEQIILSCSSCNLAHRLTVRSFTTQASAGRPSIADLGSERTAADHLAECVDNHREAIGIYAMDVLQESVGFRCAECRRTFDLDIAQFETHQR
ncbi:MAG: hypothetical protein C4293_09120 [Nitrospiraceae bacterium]